MNILLYILAYYLIFALLVACLYIYLYNKYCEPPELINATREQRQKAYGLMILYNLALPVVGLYQIYKTNKNGGFKK